MEGIRAITEEKVEFLTALKSWAVPKLHIPGLNRFLLPVDANVR